MSPPEGKIVAMVDIEKLMKGLPSSALEPNPVAFLSGFIDVPTGGAWRDSIRLLEPPAGQRVPYIDPVAALEILLRRRGVAQAEAPAHARAAVARMRAAVADDRWVVFLDDLDPESPACLPVPDFVGWLREERNAASRRAAEHGPCAQEPEVSNSGDLLMPPDILDFFEQAAEVAATTPMFRGPDNRTEPWSLQTLPALPTRKAMIEFVPGAPWADIDGWVDWRAADNPFMRWREAIRPVALELEKALGEPVYYFADLDCDTDDDAVHRFLVLHWCCTWKPDSAYVRFLLKASGAEDVEELEAALIDPASYTQPFEMNDAFFGLEAQCCRFEYLPPGRRKTVVVVFSTAQARDAAQQLIAQQIGAHVCVVAPRALASDEWLKQATRRCASWEARLVHGHQIKPTELPASIDALCVVADEARPKRGFDLRVPEPVEDLLRLAIDLGVEVKYYGVDGSQLANPELSLQRRGVPVRIATEKGQEREALDIAGALRAAVGPHVTGPIQRESGQRLVGGAASEAEGPRARVSTEDEAVTAFAKAWNRLEPDGFLALLAPDARYASQWVFEELVGAPAIVDYLRGKMRAVRAYGVNDSDRRVRVEVGRTTHGDDGRPCAFMTQGRDDAVQAAVLFEVADGKVIRCDLCIPQVLRAVRTGVFPI